MLSSFRHAPCFLTLLCTLGWSGAHYAVAAPLQNTTPENTTPAGTVSPQGKQNTSLQIDNKNGLITVKDKDAAPLFAQVIATKKLKIVLSTEAKSLKLKVTLRDETGKKLWETRIGSNTPDTFSFQWKEGKDGGEGIVLSLTSKEGKQAESAAEEHDASKGLIVLDDDGRIASADIFAVEDSPDGGGMHMERKGSKYVMYNYDEQGKRVEAGSIDIDAARTQTTFKVGDQVYSIGSKDKDTVEVKDTVGSVKLGKVVKNGKTYIVMDLGDRHIFIEGTAYEVKSDGKDITVDLHPENK
ncbi:MAG: hypothetical protein EOO38_07100 [Cytophagaceae bacterium]|nr:MAG: hypothetical protein EOO38_07100 [Cytophagaceae bacterium]